MQHNSQTSRARLALALAAFSAAFSAVFNKFALGQQMHPIWINVVRLGFALLIMILLGIIKPAGEGKAPLTRRTRMLSALSGILLAAHLLCWVYALQLTDALAATTIWSTYLFMAALGSVLLLHEQLPRIVYLPMALAVLGVVICGNGMDSGSMSGNLFALGAAVTYAAYLLCGRVVRRSTDTFRYTMTVYSVALGTLLLCALLLRVPTSGFNLISLGSTLGLAVFSTLLGHSMVSYSLKSISATTVSTVMLTEVITGPILVFLLLGEAPARSTLIGGAVILIAVVWYLWIDIRKP
ncbi:DMT family transporter [Eubacteriales bacterium OttesenSCG-928-N13]|nr:DMT family transporter [Eubacteriales bacterium OttesenSCG-928-N13]